PGLEDHRRVVDDDAHEALLGQLGEPRLKALADRRMRDRLEPPAALGIGEDDRAEALAVEHAVGGDDVGPELRGDRRPRRPTRPHHLARQDIGVDDLATELTQECRDRALPRPDAAGEPDQQELAGRAHTSAQSLPLLTSTTTGTLSGSASAMISRARSSTAST